MRLQGRQETLRPIVTEVATPGKPADQRRANRVLARCLADLDVRGELGAPFDRASGFLATLVPALYAGDADAVRTAIGGSGLGTRDLLDLVLRARSGMRRSRREVRAERERAAETALRVLAEREEAGRPDGERRQLAAVHQRLLALLTDGVLTARPDGRLLHANRAAREALGLRLRELKDTEVPALFARPDEGTALWAKIRREGTLRAREVDLRSVTGRTIPVRISGAQADGPDPRVLLVFRDLTEIRHIRSRLLETEKLGAMAKIAGSVAHEIRNPLHALFLNADLLEEELREGDAVPPSIEEILVVMREEIERLNEIIKHYLSLSKLVSTNFEPLDLNQVVRDVAEEAEEETASRNVALRLRLARGEVPIRADRNMIRRVVVNLAQNAIDATPEGGTITVGTRRLIHKIKLWVRDSGPGIPAEVEGQLFQPFFSTKERGTGLGLYLIREIVMAHEGRVAIRSLKPQGAQATVLLPRFRPRPEDNGRGS